MCGWKLDVTRQIGHVVYVYFENEICTNLQLKSKQLLLK